MSFLPLSFTSLPEPEMRRRALAFYEEIRPRRTVRDFSPRAVPREVVADCLRAAGTAPSPRWRTRRSRPSSFRMKRFLLLVSSLLAAVLGAAQTPAPDPIETQVAALVAAPHVTVVHFWAPWCPNCRAEMTPDGWAKFIAANPDVQVVFINIWHRNQDAAPKLTAGGLGDQPNLTLLTHSNPVSRAGPERLNTFLGLPVTWLPTTWVFRDGKLRYALNYGEVRFEMLQTLVNDSRDAWKH